MSKDNKPFSLLHLRARLENSGRRREEAEKHAIRGRNPPPHVGGYAAQAIFEYALRCAITLVAKTRAGHPYYAGNWARQNFDAPTRNREMLHHEICPCDAYRGYFLKTARRIVEGYGFGNLQLDQISEKMLPCYNERHHHAQPDRAYVDGLAELLPKTRAALRQINPDGVMIGEWINDFTAQWLDGSWSWRQTDFPEPVLHTLPWVMMSHELDALEYEANKAFTYKLYLDMKIDGGDSPITKYPQFAAHTKRLASLRRRVFDY